jgi:hypothetical protein
MAHEKSGNSHGDRAREMVRYAGPAGARAARGLMPSPPRRRDGKVLNGA